MTQPPKMGTGLEEVNIPGQAYLREALTSCTDPLKAIESFQVCCQETHRTFVFIIKLYFSWKMVCCCLH